MKLVESSAMLQDIFLSSFGRDSNFKVPRFALKICLNGKPQIKISESLKIMEPK